MMQPMTSAGTTDDATPPEGEAGADKIGIEVFGQVDMRVGTILKAEPVPKADRLLRLEVGLGEATPRQLVAGIAPYYTLEELIGRRIIVVANLQPRTLRGLESRGMLLAASAEGGRPALVTVTDADVPNGARLR
jgi:methionyl-tRNA synthetase